MSRFDYISQELADLQKDLQSSVDWLWRIKFMLTSLENVGLTSEEDFLPRRLRNRLKEAESRFTAHIDRLNRIISHHLSGAFLMLSSSEDIEAVAKIRRTIRYIRNSFVGEPFLGETLAKLNLVLPNLSRN